ncbi:MAG: ADP-ribosylglycohydrolase family protein [Lentisphaerae bacterium]|nr:ADP-ribosylglycohydrolase family protein [Lentisphaerota bacterium]
MNLRIPYPAYRDKVLAGWIGKSLGGVVGAPYENHKLFGDVTPDTLWPSFNAPNDDLDIQIVWLEAMQERGVFLTSRELAEYWLDRCWYNFCEYGHFLYNAQRGIAPPLSGTWNNQFFWESEGCPIRAEIWGLVAPGNPELAADLAQLDAQLDHGGASVRIERFLAAAIAQAFVCDELDKVLATALTVVPADCPEARMVAEVRRICERYPEHRRAWRQVIRAYGDRDASKAITNQAIVLMALFLGRLDFKRTMLLCVNSGWDTDCTAATAGALLGVLRGLEGLPADWRTKLGANLVCEIAVKHKNAPPADFSEDTARVGVEMAFLRNRAVTLTDAPTITIRPPPEPAFSIEVDYLEEPVLWNVRATPVRLIAHNPTAQAREGTLRVTAPSGIRVELDSAPATVSAGGRHEWRATIRRKTPGAWLADKNLFMARWLERGEEKASREFGLGGARQWLVYGPYWDAWDMARHSQRPWPKIAAYGEWYWPGPDSYNQHARLDHPYLDEQRLGREEIPEEDPFRLERGEDLIEEAHLGGFKGQCCYYLTRTLRVAAPPGAAGVSGGLTISQNGPYRAWLDGREVAASGEFSGWTHGSGGSSLPLTHQPHRLVLKVVRLTDRFAVSVLFLGAGDPEKKRGISYIHDCIEDLPPGIG